MNTLNQPRLLLTKLRGGDYAHAGGSAASRMVLDKVLEFSPALKAANVLDVGSGFGGTAEYFRQQGFQNIFGVDIDAAAVAYAKQHYPEIYFSVADALNLRSALPSQKFGFIYLFNVAYAIPDKERLIRSITQVADRGCVLVLYDYVWLNDCVWLTGARQDAPPALQDLAGRPMHPMNVGSITQTLAENKWQVLCVDDITQQAAEWYRETLENLSAKRDALRAEFVQETISKVQDVFGSLRRMMTEGALGSAIIYARLTD